jgi:cellulose synthase (UDP-forming)
LSLTSVVAIWRDLDNSQLTLATAWNLTNTAILAAFLVVAAKESWRIRHPRHASASTRPVEPAELLTTVIVPPALQSTLGISGLPEGDPVPRRAATPSNTDPEPPSAETTEREQKVSAPS